MYIDTCAMTHPQSGEDLGWKTLVHSSSPHLFSPLFSETRTHPPEKRLYSLAKQDWLATRTPSLDCSGFGQSVSRTLTLFLVPSLRFIDITHVSHAHMHELGHAYLRAVTCDALSLPLSHVMDQYVTCQFNKSRVICTSHVTNGRIMQHLLYMEHGVPHVTYVCTSWVYLI